MDTKIGSNYPPRNGQICPFPRKNTSRLCFLHSKRSIALGDRYVPRFHTRRISGYGTCMAYVLYVIVRRLFVLLAVLLGRAKVSQGVVPRRKIKEWFHFDAHQGSFSQPLFCISSNLIPLTKMMLGTFLSDQTVASSSTNKAGKDKIAVSGIGPDIGGWCYVGSASTFP